MAKEHLIRAKELIQNGWVKTTLKKRIDGKPCYCLDGAIAEAHGYDAFNVGAVNVYSVLETDPEVYNDVTLVYDSLLPFVKDHPLSFMFNPKDNEEVVQSLWRYNDRVAKTREDVIAVLDSAIAKAE